VSVIPIIRAAQAVDAERVAEIHVRAWQWAHRDLLPAAFLAGLSVERRTAYWRRWLSDSGLHRHRWLSWVLESNARARRFYERCDWYVDGGEKAEEFGDRTAREVRYRKAFTA
jgi:hypothetical protein